MPYAANFMRMSVLHHILDTDETSQWDLTLSSPVILAGGYPDLADLTTIRDAVYEYLNATSSGRATYSRWDGVKFALTGTDGHYIEDPLVLEAGPGSPGGSVTGLPAQSSVVTTLWSGSSLGKGNYGRFYHPYSGPTSAATPYMSTDLQSTFLTAAQGLVNDIEDVLGEGSVIINSDSTAGPQQKSVQFVRVGRVPDTQRRRRRSLDESYTQAAV